MKEIVLFNFFKKNLYSLYYNNIPSMRTKYSPNSLIVNNTNMSKQLQELDSGWMPHN